ncbi:MAG: metallophosphoesterase [Thermoleophilaceae bacterium]
MPSFGFAHLSDIHLAGYAEGALFDLDSDVRAELELDLERVTEEVGGLDAILVAGDIAGKGLQREFDVAATWVDSLCELLGAPPERVYCVPGNHDITWDVIAADPVLDAVQEQLLTCRVEEVAGRLEGMLSSGPHRGLLLAALENYNAFAARYGCGRTPFFGPPTVRVGWM